MNQVAMLFGAILALSAIVTLSPADAQVRDHRNGVADQDQRPGPAAGNGPRLGRAHGGVIVTGSPMHGKRR